MSCTQKLLVYSAKIAVEVAKEAEKEMKSKVYLVFGVQPYYTFENGRHHYKLPNGKYHRLDGPACYGKGKDEYFINGEQYLISDFWKKMKDTKHSKRIMANILGSRSLNK